MSLIPFKFECKYCEKKFKQETWFLKHECKEKKRYDKFDTPKGQLAYLIYKRWILKSKHGRVSKDSFLTSRYYRTFIRISEYLIDVNIVNTNMFVDYMVNKKYTPHLWCGNDAYVEFLNHLDHKERPKKMIEISINTILKESDKRNIKPSEFFDSVDAYEIIHLFQSRKLSPWVVCFSDKFRKFYREKLKSDQRIFMDTLLNVDKWVKKFGKHPRIVKQVKVYIKELEL